MSPSPADLRRLAPFIPSRRQIILDCYSLYRKGDAINRETDRWGTFDIPTAR